MTRLSKYVKREAKQLFRLCIKDGLLDEGRAHRVVQHVLRARRGDSLKVLDHFRRLVKLDREQHSAEIDSAIVLSADLQAEVQASLEQMYGPGIRTTFVQNSSLIGGMRIRIGSDVYDGSIKGRLAVLENKF